MSTLGNISNNTEVYTKSETDTEIGNAISSAKPYQGGYNASTNTPDLDSTPIAGILAGDTWDTEVAGTFFTIPLEIGDTITAKQDNPTLEAHWFVNQNNLTAASIKTQYESNANTNGVTDTEKTNLGNLSGTNSGDETTGSIQSKRPLKTVGGTSLEGAGDVPVGGDLSTTDIDTLAELNAIITDATLIDTTDSRLSDARTPTAHTHTASEVTDFDTEVSNNTSVAANTAKVTNVTTNLSEGTTTNTTVDVNSSDGTNATLAAASTSRAGVMSKAKFDEVVANNAKVTNATHTGDVTGSGALTIGTNKVTNAKAAQMAANTVKVNATGSLANAQDIAMAASTFLVRLAAGNIVAGTVAQVKTLIGNFTSSLAGLVPSSGGGTTNFLRADGTWAAPPAGGSSRVTGSVTTTDATSTEIDKIDTLTDNSTHLIEVYITCEDDANTKGGTWKRTLRVSKRGGTVVIQSTQSDFTSAAAGLNANSVSFAVNSGDVDIDGTGINATNFQWNSSYEIITKSTY